MYTDEACIKKNTKTKGKCVTLIEKRVIHQIDLNSITSGEK